MHPYLGVVCYDDNPAGIIIADRRRDSLSCVTVLPLAMLVAYLLLILHFRRGGGYRAVRPPAAAPP